MSDSDKDRRKRAGRGSMLDHAPARDEREPAYGGDVQPTIRSGSPRLPTRPADMTDSARGAPPPLGAFKTSAAGDHEDAPGDKPSLGEYVGGLLGKATRPISGSGPEPTSAEIAVEPENTPQPAGQPDQYLARPGEGGYYLDELARPLIDPSILIAAVWRHRRLIVATTILGAVAGVFLAITSPREYYAENRLFIDPREIRLTDNEPAQFVSTEAMIALTDSQVEILSSNTVLSKVVDKLGLERDPEFNGSLPASGLSAGIGLILELLRGKDSSPAGKQEALRTLHHSLTVARDPKTFVVNVGVTTRDPEKSALVANSIVETFLAEEGEVQSNLMERTSEAIDTRIEALQADLNSAERAVEEYKAQNDLVGIGGELLHDKQVLALTEQLAAARAQKVAVKVKADGLARANLEEVLVGAFPEEFLSATLIDLRKQYSQSKANADSLGTRLGPRHPQYVGALSSLESIRNEIRAELRRIVGSSQAELQRAVETEQELASQLAVSKNTSLDNSVELVTLRELERKANATREIYEAFLKRSRETSERGNLSTRNMRVISAAEPPLSPDGTSRKVIAIGATLGGTALGVVFALLTGMFDSFRGSNSGPRGARSSLHPTGGPHNPRPFPEGPNPGSRVRKRDLEPTVENAPARAIPAEDKAAIRAEADLAAAEAARGAHLKQIAEDQVHAAMANAQAVAAGFPSPPSQWPAPPASFYPAGGVPPYMVQSGWPGAQAPLHPAPVWPYGPYATLQQAPTGFPQTAFQQPGLPPFAPEPSATSPVVAPEIPAASDGEIARIRDDMRRLRERIGRNAPRRRA